MSLTPERLSELIIIISGSQRTEYISLGFYTFFLHYYLVTVAMEVKLLWPRKRHWGKLLFLVNRYTPMLVFAAQFIQSYRVYITISPKACTVVHKIFIVALSRVYNSSAEAIRLGSAIVTAFRLSMGWYSIPGQVLDTLATVATPILANRLLLNMWRTQDPDVRKTVSSILFDPPRPGEDSDDDDEEFADRPMEMVRYEGLGRRRAPARKETEGASQGGAGATQAVENGEGA
ncbi:hypothetical protein DFP72DRAFT_1178155 [Ephemerocybe angulata]|uniref:DUF6533 domain-containing protein n=1 Tax=Ephemerocybe angulata TaxID=980116 RepID=A0A8H6HBT8_9AGAR|nr:hypothetical protein DFP72DRAFT_1178155 [Tulosesus angulatus]